MVGLPIPFSLHSKQFQNCHLPGAKCYLVPLLLQQSFCEGREVLGGVQGVGSASKSSYSQLATWLGWILGTHMAEEENELLLVVL